MASSPRLKLLYSPPPICSFVNGRLDENFIGVAKEPAGLPKRIIFDVGLELLDDEMIYSPIVSEERVVRGVAGPNH